MKNCIDYEAAVVATVTQEVDLTYLESESTSASELSFEVLEFRLDNLNDQSRDRILDLQRAYQKSHAILSTARHPKEGGHNNLTENQRVDWLEASLVSSDLIDIEVRSLGSKPMQQLLDQAQKQSVTVAASYHNFEGYPSAQELVDQVSRAFDLGANIAKLAVVVETHQQLMEMIDLVETTVSEGCKISAMGMGRLGKLSRLTLANAGSCLNYGYLNEPNAPGQWPATELRRLIDECK